MTHSLGDSFSRLVAWFQPVARSEQESFSKVRPSLDDPPPQNGVRLVEEIGDESRDA